MRHSNQLIGESKAIIRQVVRQMLESIPPGHGQWNHCESVLYKDSFEAATTVCDSPKSTLDQIVNAYWSMKGFWR